MYSSYILVSPYNITLGVNTKATAPPNAAPCRARAALLSAARHGAAFGGVVP